MVSDILDCPACGHPIRFNTNTNTKPQCENCGFPLKEYKSILENVKYLSKEPNGNEEIKSKIQMIIEWKNEYSLIPKIKQLLQDIRIIIFTETNPYNLVYHNQKKEEAKRYYDELDKLIKQFEGNGLTRSFPVDRKPEHLQSKNSQIKQDVQPQAYSNNQLQQEIQKQIAPLQTQLQQLIPLQNQLQKLDILEKQLQKVIQLISQQNTANQSNSPSVASQAVQREQEQIEDTYHSKYIAESPRQSNDVTRKENNTLNPALGYIPSWLKSYNQKPESFEKYQHIPVSITDESIHQCRLGSSQPIILEYNKKGNYWIFSDNNNGYLEICLVPKANLKINEYGLETMKFLFEVLEENIGNYTKIKVIFPAILMSVQHEKWQLKSLGKLEFETD
ncbi:phage tail tape measure protein [Anabaena minutissima FACHB-250]|nr:phage tail tape measure protein [Anabaena minutissima FACHB-250]